MTEKRVDNEYTDQQNGLMNNRSMEPSIFTLGYQDLSIQQFIEKLENNSIRVLIDIRKNAVSRKAGFSKRRLSEMLNDVGIEYYHFPDLGIPSSHRKKLDLANRKTYDSLFNFYEENIIPLALSSVDLIKELANEKKRVALACFETDPVFCHRSRLSEIIARDQTFADRVLHI